MTGREHAGWKQPASKGTHPATTMVLISFCMRVHLWVTRSMGDMTRAHAVDDVVKIWAQVKVQDKDELMHSRRLIKQAHVIATCLEYNKLKFC